MRTQHQSPCARLDSPVVIVLPRYWRPRHQSSTWMMMNAVGFRKKMVSRCHQQYEDALRQWQSSSPDCCLTVAMAWYSELPGPHQSLVSCGPRATRQWECCYSWFVCAVARTESLWSRLVPPSHRRPGALSVDLAHSPTRSLSHLHTRHLPLSTGRESRQPPTMLAIW